MAKQAKNHNKEEEDLSEYLNENCSICRKKFRKLSDILVSIENDVYICVKCSKKHDINAVECIDYI